MKSEMIERAEKLDAAYFGDDRTLEERVDVLVTQMQAMVDEPSVTNIRRQMGDMYFVLINMARAEGCDLEELLAETIAKIERNRRDRHYYEAHVTINPVFGEHLERFKSICAEHKFHVAKLHMRRSAQAPAEPSSDDQFCTSRSISLSDIKKRMVKVVASLQEAGYVVRRGKIEETLYDSRHNDGILNLPRDWLPEKERNPGAPADGALPGRNSDSDR